MSKNLSNKETEKVFATGFKGFGPDMKCRNKQYAENTVFEEKGGNICDSGVMHFCEYPLSVFEYYPPADDSGKINTFAPVEALAAPQKREDKSATTKIRIGAKIDFAGLAKAAVDFVLERVKKEKTESNTGDKSVASTSGDKSVASTSGDWSAASVGGKESFAIATGIEGKVKGALGCYIACAEWTQDENFDWHVKNFKAAKVDGKKIKPDTFYMLKNGKFVEVGDEK